MKPNRILLAGLFHETNTFSPGTMGLDQFATLRGDELLSTKGNGSPMGAFLEEAERYGWEVFPTIDMRATPGAMPSPEVIATFLEGLMQGLSAPEAEECSAIFLVLHGAMASPGIPDVEGEVLRQIRNHPNPRVAALPIFGVLDLHGNISPEMAEHSNGLLVYRKNPHTDSAETAVRASALLERTLRKGLTLATRFVSTAILWPPPGTATAAEPMQTLEALARAEEQGGVEEVNVFAGFAHADVPWTGVSFTIVYDTAKATSEQIDQLAEKLHTKAEELKTLGLVEEWEIDAAIADAAAKGRFPVCLVEPADNIGGGATGDGTSILRALLRHQLAGSGVVICDPESVEALQGAAPGSEHELEVGGKVSPLDPGPVKVRARLLRLSDGRYTLEDRHSHAASMSGVHMNMGPCAVIDAEGVIILLTSRRSAPMDLGQWRSQGVNPEELRFIGVKAAVAHRQAYDRITDVNYWVRTPGACASDIASLPYENVRRPVFPLNLV